MKELLGKEVTLFGLNYIYHGKLIEIDGNDLILEDAAIVYETGPFTEKKFADAQKLGCNWTVNKDALESWGPLNKK